MSEELKAENAKLKYVPGQLRCKKCGCSVIKQTLYMKSGSVGVDRSPDDCPNGCGPMWRISWPDHIRDYADGTDKIISKLQAENAKLREALEFCFPRTTHGVDHGCHKCVGITDISDGVYVCDYHKAKQALSRYKEGE